jgi:proteic killer suppression protein
MKIDIDVCSATGYIVRVIGSVKHKALRRYIEMGDRQGLPPDCVARLKRLVSALGAAESLDELETVPGWRLHPLKGELKGFWSLSVTGNWRLIFSWSNGRAEDLDLVDYH